MGGPPGGQQRWWGVWEVWRLEGRVGGSGGWVGGCSGVGSGPVRFGGVRSHECRITDPIRSPNLRQLIYSPPLIGFSWGFFPFFFFDPSLAFYARSHQIKLTPVPCNRGAVTKQCTKPPPPPPRPCRTSCSPPFIALIRFLFLSVPVAWVELRVGPPWGAGHCTPRRSQRERSGPLPGLAFGDSGWSPEVLRGGGGGGEASPRCPEGARRPSGKGPRLAQAGWGGRGCRCVSRGAPSGWSRWPPSVHLGSPPLTPR
ncbi:PREDICTED: uncharacterized protein LOC101383307 [Odobenus rosmarus divergens]|uniref:Uncharacterized protein LOC101383307 n=1 Tax=Odobenus rosmarus divergens TaxID=9708 RepID=A0A9B0GPP0_ODORO